MHSRVERTDERQGRSPARSPARRDQEAGGHPGSSAGMSTAEVLELQRTVGNRAAARAVQRADDDEITPVRAPAAERTPAAGQEQAAQPEQGAEPEQGLVVAPAALEARERLTEALIETREQQLRTNFHIRKKLEERVKAGPLFNADEIALIKRCDRWWLNAIGIGRYQDAEKYFNDADYHTWLRQDPGKRVLVATIAWPQGRASEVGSRVRQTPAYTLARALVMRSRAAGLTDEEYQALEAERDQQIRNAFVETLLPGNRPDDASEKDARKVARAREILTRVFLILQNGLKVYKEESRSHVDYQEGDVARALAHGGRVNIRIPALSEGEKPYDLADFIGLTRGGKDVNPGERRGFGTHRSKIGENEDGSPGRFEERGGFEAGAKNIGEYVARRLGAHKLGLLPDNRMWGVDLAADGWGRTDFNGDVITPDGGHGHMFARFQPPDVDTDGVLVVGIETTGPGAKSPFGYQHNIFSTEKTSNPDTSFYTHKVEKIGEGKLNVNQRMVLLQEFGGEDGGWLGFLRDVEAYWNQMAEAVRGRPEEERALYERLVGRRAGHFRPPQGQGPS